MTMLKTLINQLVNLFYGIKLLNSKYQKASTHNAGTWVT
jgi:hypothetical protein